MGETQQPTDGVDEILRDDGLWFLQKAQRGAKPLEKPLPHFGDKPVKVFAIKVNIDNE